MALVRGGTGSSCKDLRCCPGPHDEVDTLAESRPRSIGSRRERAVPRGKIGRVCVPRPTFASRGPAQRRGSSAIVRGRDRCVLLVHRVRTRRPHSCAGKHRSAYGTRRWGRRGRMPDPPELDPPDMVPSHQLRGIRHSPRPHPHSAPSKVRLTRGTPFSTCTASPATNRSCPPPRGWPRAPTRPPAPALVPLTGRTGDPRGTGQP